MPHKSVLLQETLAGLNLKPGDIVVDGTLGSGGHAQAILKLIGEKGRLIGLDFDPEALKRCQETLKDQKQVSYHHENFRFLGRILEKLNIPNVNAVLLDIGIASEQLEDAKRGFSFQSEGELDMRMNPLCGLTAKELVQKLSEQELQNLFRNYGEGRWARRFASAIVRTRQAHPIQTTKDLAETLEGSLPRGLRFQKGKRPPWARRHPATRAFQALRISVNDELGALKDGIAEGFKYLVPGGRMAVISFHSLEDRIVKRNFLALRQEGKATLITKKPLIPSDEESGENPRARSAKLRILEKT